MPIGVLSRIPNSVSQGGKCRSNLRGVTPSAPYDYANPARTFNVTSATGSISTAEAGAWANTIQKAYYSTDSEGDASLRYQGGVLSTARSGTILFRMYIQEFPPLISIPDVQTIFNNGAEATDGYGIKLRYMEVGVETFEWNLYFARLQDTDREDWIKLNTSPLSTSTWYQFSVRFNTVTGDKGETTTIVAYQNGSAQVDEDLANPIETPSSNVTTTILGFYGRMTDFAFLESQLTDVQLAAYGTAPYI